MPRALSRRDEFDRIVARAVLHLAAHEPRIMTVDVVVEEVPRVTRRTERAPLGRVVRQINPVQLVVHRRPIEQLGAGVALVRDVLAELAGEWLNCPPAAVDPHYPRL